MSKIGYIGKMLGDVRIRDGKTKTKRRPEEGQALR